MEVKVQMEIYRTFYYNKKQFVFALVEGETEPKVGDYVVTEGVCYQQEPVGAEREYVRFFKLGFGTVPKTGERIKFVRFTGADIDAMYDAA